VARSVRAFKTSVETRIQRRLVNPKNTQAAQQQLDRLAARLGEEELLAACAARERDGVRIESIAGFLTALEDELEHAGAPPPSASSPPTPPTRDIRVGSAAPSDFTKVKEGEHEL
jgi:hypothetical protein